MISVFSVKILERKESAFIRMVAIGLACISHPHSVKVPEHGLIVYWWCSSFRVAHSRPLWSEVCCLPAQGPGNPV